MDGISTTKYVESGRSISHCIGHLFDLVSTFSSASRWVVSKQRIYNRCFITGTSQKGNSLEFDLTIPEIERNRLLFRSYFT